MRYNHSATTEGKVRSNAQRHALTPEVCAGVNVEPEEDPPWDITREEFAQYEKEMGDMKDLVETLNDGSDSDLEPLETCLRLASSQRRRHLQHI